MANFRLRAWFREKVLGHSPQEIFSRIYERNSWADAESVSGAGSDLVQTRAVRAGLVKVVESLSVETMLDAPCGDYFWMQTLNLKLRRYVGADIVPALIRANKEKYASDAVQFETLDITADPLPRSDRSSAAIASFTCRCKQCSTPEKFQEERVEIPSDDNLPRSAEGESAIDRHGQLAAARPYLAAVFASAADSAHQRGMHRGRRFQGKEPRSLGARAAAALLSARTQARRQPFRSAFRCVVGIFDIPPASRATMSSYHGLR